MNPFLEPNDLFIRRASDALCEIYAADGREPGRDFLLGLIVACSDRQRAKQVAELLQWGGFPADAALFLLRWLEVSSSTTPPSTKFTKK